MAKLEQSSGWGEFVDRAVDSLVADLRRPSAEEAYTEVLEARVDLESAQVRARLTSFALELLGAAGAGTGSLECDDGRSTVDCTFVLRPNDSPYYRCLGHAPPHCYDSTQQTISCP